MSQTVSLRIPDESLTRLDSYVRLLGNGVTRSRAIVMLLEEDLREIDFPGIEFRNTAIGRLPFAKRTGMAVWEFVMIGREFDMNGDRISEHLMIPIDAVTAALNYYAAYKEEIDQIVADNDSYDEEKLRRIFPNLHVFSVPKKELEQAS